MGLIQVVYGLIPWMQKNDFYVHELLKIISGDYVDKIDLTKAETILNKWGRSPNNFKTTGKVIPMKIVSFLTVIFLLLSFIFDNGFVYADELLSHWNPYRSYIPPTNIVGSGGDDMGVRLIDLNGDGLLDIVQSRGKSHGAWINNGNSWRETKYITPPIVGRSEEHTSELESPDHLVCRLLLEKKKNYAVVLTGTVTLMVMK